MNLNLVALTLREGSVIRFNDVERVILNENGMLSIYAKDEFYKSPAGGWIGVSLGNGVPFVQAG